MEITNLFLQLAILLVAAFACGNIAWCLKQPRVLGELIGGVILGPTVLGLIAPDFWHYTFAVHPEGREAIVKIALLVFLFTVGLEMDLSNLWRQRKVVFSATALGILVPFGLGFWAVQSFPSLWGLSANILLAAFIGTALSISALPVIARILTELELLKSNFGSLVLASASLTDIVGWALFAVILKSHGGSVPGVVIDITLGAFLFGVICSRFWREGKWQKNFLWVVRNVGAPIYFVSVGLKVNFVAHFDGMLVVVVFLIACLGKVVGVTAGATWAGLPFRQSLAASFALNARGAMEIVLATVALETGLINERIFVALFIMALGTSILSGPVIQRLIKR